MKYLYTPSANVVEINFPTPLKDPRAALLRTVPEGKPLVVKFYAPWCGHCRHFKPKWESVAVTFSKSPVTVGAVSCDAYSEVCKDQGIHGYPTLKAFNVGDGEGGFTSKVVKRGKVKDIVEEVSNLYSIPLPEVVDWDGLTTKKVSGAEDPAASSEVPSPALAVTDVSATTMNVKHDIYRDAFKSLFFTLYQQFPSTIEDFGGGEAKGGERGGFALGGEASCKAAKLLTAPELSAPRILARTEMSASPPLTLANLLPRVQCTPTTSTLQATQESTRCGGSRATSTW